MRRPAKLLLSSVLLAGCATAPPAVVSSGLIVAPALSERRPSQIAILPIEDATPQRSFEGVAGHARSGIEQRLAARGYSPLAPRYVDDKLAAIGQLDTPRSALDVAWLGELRDAFQEDALLALRVVEWDARSVVETRRVDFVVELLMLATSDGAVLWSGRVEGDVKAGGEGPSPISREQRIESAAEVMGQVLIDRLPIRRPG